MKKLLALFFVGVFVHTSIAQEIPSNIDPNQLTPSQIAQIDIDKLSDAQIQIFVQRFEESGLSEQEMEFALKARGLPEIQISKLKARMIELKRKGIQSGTGFDRMRSRETSPPTEQDIYDVLSGSYQELIEKDEFELQSKIFGFNIFKSELLTFEPNLNIATPKNYILGPGDEIVIDIWGASEQTYQETISPDGYIKIPNVGPVYLSGYTIEKAQQRLKSRLSQIYAGLNPQGGRPANTFSQISLGQVRTIRVSVIGEVLRPGTFNISSLATIGNALYLSGGPNVNGSLRNIELIRNGKVIKSFDGYDFLVRGKQAENVRIEDQDIIRITPYEHRVEIIGEVKREGIYEVKENETFADLVHFAGGFTEQAYSGLIKVKRNNGATREFLDVTTDEIDKVNPKNGDIVKVEGIINKFENRVQVRGAVYREGDFELTEGLTISGLIQKAQGLRGDAFLDRGTIYRIQEDLSTAAIPFNFRRILKGEEEDVLLSREDVVKISSIYDLTEEFYVQIFGEVRNPSVYPFAHNMTVEALILQAGGLRESASGAHIEIARRVKEAEGNVKETAEIFSYSIDEKLALKDAANDFILMPFDQVFVRRSPAYQTQVNIKVEGEAQFPGAYALKKKDERVSDMINRAGGLTPEGFAQGATLIRRTEFNPPKSDDLQRLENLNELKTTSLENIEESGNYETVESENLMLKRIGDVESDIEEYNEAEDAEVGREGINVRRQKLDRILERDSIDTEQAAIKFETIGIDLKQILENPGSKYDLILQDGDVISIPRKLETVRLRGEFLYPSTVRFDDTNSFRDYVAQAGGFSDNAKKSKAYVIYANGSVDRTRKVLFWNNYPRVERGAEVIVPKKPEGKGLSPVEVVAIASALATLALTINSLAR